MSERLLAVGAAPIAGGVVGMGGEIAWPRPNRLGGVLRAASERVEIAPSKSLPKRGMVRLRSGTRNDEVVQTLIAKLVATRRPHSLR